MPAGSTAGAVFSPARFTDHNQIFRFAATSVVFELQDPGFFVPGDRYGLCAGAEGVLKQFRQDGLRRAEEAGGFFQDGLRHTHIQGGVGLSLCCCL